MDHFISLAKAIEMTTRYRANKELILAAGFQGQDILPLAETFDRAAFDQMLALPGCEKLRIYGGMDEALKVHAIIVGVDAQDQDILPIGPNASTGDSIDSEPTSTAPTDDGTIIEAGQRCPPFCVPSVLNP